jgi:hypothetical protein
MPENPVVAALEEAFMPLLTAARNQLASQFPACTFNVWSSSTGSLTSYQGHDVGIECVFPDVKPEDANCVAAEIGIWHLTTHAEFNSYGVAWCSGDHPEISLELLDQPRPFSSEELVALTDMFPQILATFRRAIESRCASGRA